MPQQTDDVVSNVDLTLSVGQTKIGISANRIDPDETAHLDVHYLPFCFIIIIIIIIILF